MMMDYSLSFHFSSLLLLLPLLLIRQIFLSIGGGAGYSPPTPFGSLFFHGLLYAFLCLYAAFPQRRRGWWLLRLLLFRPPRSHWGRRRIITARFLLEKRGSHRIFPFSGTIVREYEILLGYVAG
uniref:(northern house mosquito) hypothetical protein n=1 Tax=Culex pipiens TaxID=7175 RepID=A0A8D8D6X9_CULPI